MALKDKDKIGLESIEGGASYAGNSNVNDLYSRPLDGNLPGKTLPVGGTAPGGATIATESVYQDSMTKALQDQNYKSFFDSAIQIYNMKSNADKYLSNELAAKGLGTQGYGSTAAAGVHSDAMNMYARNLDSYNRTEQEIARR